MNEVGITDRAGNLWTATNLAKALSEVHPGERGNPIAERRAELAAWEAEQDAAKADVQPGNMFGEFLRLTGNVRCNRGFTLLEVLVALVVLGLFAAGLNSVISNSIIRTNRALQETRATVLADNLLASLGVTLPVRVGSYNGQDRELRWYLTITPDRAISVAQVDLINLAINDAAGHPIGHWLTLRVTTVSE